jgi:hypothetical protein
MIVVAIVPVIALIVGLLMYALCANPKLATIGLETFKCGMLVTLYVFAVHVVKLS